MSESVSSAFPTTVSDRICNHMNKDHADAVLVYAQQFGNVENAESAEMKSIDAEGMNLSAQVEGQAVSIRVPFERTLQDAKEAHVILVEMLNQVRSNS